MDLIGLAITATKADVHHLDAVKAA